MALNRATDLVAHFVHSLIADPGNTVSSLIPQSWWAYIELARVNQLAGTLMLISFYGVGLTFAACISEPLLTMKEFFHLALYSDVWLVIMRHALCTFNDAIDYEYDRKVRRCCQRPVARGDITPEQALQFTAAQLLLGAWALSYLPRDSHAIGIIATLTTMIYPFGKRFTNFPQLIMGVAFAMGIFMACTVVGVDVTIGSEHFTSALCLGLVCMLIIAVADSIYAYQDLHDDIKAGVKSMTRVLGDRPKMWLWALTAAIQGLLLIVGNQNDFSPFYYLISCGGSFFALSSMLALVDLRAAADCDWWFRRCGPGCVFAVMSGLFVEYFIRLCLFS